MDVQQMKIHILLKSSNKTIIEFYNQLWFYNISIQYNKNSKNN